LILRPRGNLEARRAWSRVVLGGAFPKLEEVRFPEHDGDELVELLMQSPLLARVRRLDCTDNLTNRGAGLLSQNADRLMHLDEIWLGSGGRREQVEPLALEIDDAWRRRLKSRFGARVRFEPRPRHPDL
jgi:hypothetical protein